MTAARLGRVVVDLAQAYEMGGEPGWEQVKITGRLFDAGAVARGRAIVSHIGGWVPLVLDRTGFDRFRQRARSR